MYYRSTYYYFLLHLRYQCCFSLEDQYLYDKFAFHVGSTYIKKKKDELLLEFTSKFVDEFKAVLINATYAICILVRIFIPTACPRNLEI